MTTALSIHGQRHDHQTLQAPPARRARLDLRADKKATINTRWHLYQPLSPFETTKFDQKNLRKAKQQAVPIQVGIQIFFTVPSVGKAWGYRCPWWLHATFTTISSLKIPIPVNCHKSYTILDLSWRSITISIDEVFHLLARKHNPDKGGSTMVYHCMKTSYD